ncbi:hypothetical protein SSP24_55320 [Streptomyces spinoverrucosus]|uniref:Extensin n=1 Tax=Streptomyces spinoverrucosus TaxID=284043 RepID=A0A4Y3VM05_9ACTN|nr:hypothetical protein [Streptomyces spinoverrucosus]GEC07877.1 hypothetical protein SSP24_55320 [Streptomyces spinoverrucosus]GHB86173.1 hypothetical protein GCM10010397_67220 [Streptomyces spinoverrucosus]
MADEQYRWLNRETAERLLSGEPLDAADSATREQAARLAHTLGALSAKPPLTSDELPGEGAALAAFRKVRAERDSERAALDVPGRRQPSDAGLVHIGGRTGGRTTAARRPRWGRPVRLGLAAALAVAMAGGVAVAAGTGVLGTPPFLDDEPGPAASVSVAEPPERPQVSPPPTQREQPGSATPDGTTSGPATESPDPSGDDTPSTGGDTERSTGGDAGNWRKAVILACRDVRDGKSLDAARKRALTEAAGGSSGVRKYCAAVLGGSDAQEDKGSGKGDKGDGEKAGGKDGDEGSSSGDGGEGDGEGGTAPGLTGGSGSLSGSPALTPGLPRRAQSLLPTPNPSQSAL